MEHPSTAANVGIRDRDEEPDHEEAIADGQAGGRGDQREVGGGIRRAVEARDYHEVPPGRLESRREREPG